MSLLFDSFVEDNYCCTTDSTVCTHTVDKLKATLTDMQMKLLQKLIDEKNELIAQAARDNYAKGFSEGLEFGCFLRGHR